MKIFILAILLMANSCILEGCTGGGIRDQAPKTPIEMVEDARIVAISVDKQIGTLLDLKSITKAEAEKFHREVSRAQTDLDLAGGLFRDAVPGNDGAAMDSYRLALNALVSIRNYLASKEPPR